MNPRWMFVALTSALVGCPDARTATCNDDPTLAECVVDGGTVGGLTYRTHPRKIGLDYVPVQVGACGSYLREIDWQMPGGAPDDGYIVQQIQVSWSGVCPTRDEQVLATCDVDVPAACLDESGTPDYPPAEVEFWEAWRILRGTETPAADGRSDDTWSADPQAVPEGRFEIVGRARFYTDADLGPERPGVVGSPWETSPGPRMNNRLPTTSVEPDFWRADGRPRVVRRAALSWVCCPPQETAVEEDTHDR